MRPLTAARTESRVARNAPPGFFVGYLDGTPRPVARFVRRVAAGLVVLTAALGAGLAVLLERFDQGVFEYGTVRDYSGELLVDPHPRLLTADGPADGYLLVAVGKHGLGVDEAPSRPWQPGPPRKIELAGTLIQNAEAAMLEVHSLTLPDRHAADDATTDTGPPDSPEAGGSAPAGERGNPTTGEEAVTEEHRLVVRADTLVGEIVDTKCYLGAMKPGRGKPHRDCASLCIRGGIPAALLVRTESGERQLVHLVNFGRPVGSEVLDLVGQPVEVTGLLRRKDGRLLLNAFSIRATHSSVPPLDLLRQVTSSQPGASQ